MTIDNRTRDRRLSFADSVLLLLPTEHNKLTLAWNKPHEIFVEKVRDFDYMIEISPGMVKTYHVNIL